ncbi:MAG: transporter substrate-binding domain-containing protein, partial [Desulfamplus sp.]|nr:transporter substrate-binding domain-containing protein [Desulfamplus sp.]
MKKSYSFAQILMLCFILPSFILSANLTFSQESESGTQTPVTQEIKVGGFNFEPFYVVEDGKEPSGLLVDYIKAALTKSNMSSYSVEGYPPKRLYMYLAEGDVDLCLGVKGVPALEGNVIYSNEKITDIDLRLYYRQETMVLKSKEELRGKRILTIRGYSYGGFIKYLANPENNIVMDVTNGHELAFKKLQAKRADYVLDYSFPSDETL